MSICFFETNEFEQVYLQNALADEVLHFIPTPLTRGDQIPSLCEGAEILSTFVHSRIDADVLSRSSNLRLVTTRSTGFDHIDLVEADRHGVVVCNVPTYGENTVAEHTFALILALSRNVHKAYVRTSAGDFSMDGLQGFDLKGKTIGVVGTGHIGTHVIRIAKGFGMEVLAYDPFPNAPLAELLGFTYTSLNSLLNRSDVVTLHAPLTPETHHMIGEHNIREFKRGALLINTARGGLVDTAALLRALDDRILSGAGLDVMEGEEILSEEKQLLGSTEIDVESLKTALRNLVLLRRPDLVITPHIGFDSREAIQRILDTTVANIRAYRQGRPQNVVRPVNRNGEPVAGGRPGTLHPAAPAIREQ